MYTYSRLFKHTQSRTSIEADVGSSSRRDVREDRRWHDDGERVLEADFSSHLFMVFFWELVWRYNAYLKRLLIRVEAGSLKPINMHIFKGLEEGVHALQFLQRAQNIGKVVISQCKP